MTTILNPILARAAITAAAAFGLPADAVTLSQGERPDSGGIHVRYHGGSSSDHPTNNLLLTIKDPNLDLMTKEEVRTAVLAGLNKLEPMKAVTLTVPDEKTATALHAKLKAATAGTSFDTRLLDWPGFNPEIAKKGWGVDDHAIADVYEGAYGVEFDLRIPTDKKTDTKKVLGELKDNVTGRLPAIRAMLTDRTVKYVKHNLATAGKTSEEIAAAEEKTRADMARLEIHVNTQDEFGVRVTMRSPEQSAVVAANGGKVDRYSGNPDNADALRASNPLHQLTSSLTEAEREANPNASAQLPKAVARAFLFAGEKAADEFALLAGRRDIQTAIAKELAKAITGHPEQAPLLQEILASNLFKNHSDWHQTEGSALSEPTIVRDATKPGETLVWINNVPEAQLKKAVLDLADVAPPTPSSILAAHQQTLAATKQSAAASADMMSLASPESATDAAPAAAAAPQSGFVDTLKSLLPASWVSRSQQQAAAPTTPQVG